MNHSIQNNRYIILESTYELNFKPNNLNFGLGMKEGDFYHDILKLYSENYLDE